MNLNIYRDIVFNGPLAYACHKILFNREGTGIDSLITEANESFAVLCNLEPSGLENRRFSEVFPESDRSERNWPVLMGETIQTGCREEIIVPGKEPGDRYVIQLFSPVKDHCITLIQKCSGLQKSEGITPESENRTSSLFNMMTLGVVYQNDEGLITAANPAAERILGLTTDQMHGRSSSDPVWKSIHEDGTDYPGNEHPVMLTLETGKPVFGKIMGIFNPESETTRWLLVDAVPEFRDGETKPYRAFATFNDITERKKVEDQLRESEEKMAGIYNVAPAGIGFLKDRVLLQINRMVCEMTGYSAEELIGKNARLLYPSQEEYDFVGKEKYRQISESGTGTVQTIWKKKDGTLLNIMLSSTPIDREDIGKGLIFTALDFTEKQRALDELKESEEKFRTAFYVSPDLTSITRLSDGLYVDVNDAFVEKSGFTRQELIGHTALELNIWENPEERKALTESLKKLGYAVNLEANFRRKCGTVMTGLMSAGLLEIKGEKHLLAFTRDITERKKMETALRNSEELYRTVVSASSDGIILQDKNGKILTWNKSAERIFGIPAEKAIGQTSVSRSYHLYREDGTEYSGTEHPSMVTLSTGMPFRNVQMKVLRSTDDVIWINVNTSPVFTDGSSKPDMVVITFSDITQLRSAREALIASAEVAKSIPSGLFIYRLEAPDQFYLLDCNPSAIELTRIDYTKSIGKEFNDIWKGKNAEELKQKLRHVMETSKPFLGTEIYYEDERMSGVYRISAFKIKDSTLGIAFEDISELKITENELIKAKVKAEENETLLRTIIENAPFEIWARDTGEVGILENQHSINHIGSILGRTPDNNGVSPEIAEMWKSNNQIVLKGNILNSECIYNVKGEDVAYQQIIAPLRKGKRIEGIVGFNININERRKADEQIRRLNEELENRVEERTFELQLANKELEAFAYTVSHDLRAPLRAIDGFANILREDYEKLLEDDGKKVIGIITENTRRMGILIDDLLSFSRLSRSEMNLSLVDMNTLVSQVYSEVVNPGQKEVIRFTRQSLPPVMADISLIRQVWINLISNAVKFTTGKHNPEITISARKNNNKIHFEICDNGVGFNMKYAGKLFGVFQRLHSVKDFEGTGVGLAIVQRIVVRHGGSVWADSEPGKGARFYFSLPDRTI